VASQSNCESSQCLRFDVLSFPTMPRRNTRKPIDFTIGQRVLFRYPARRPVQWLSGVISGGPMSKQGRVSYQVQLDNGESHWGFVNQFRKAEL
jgi:hypothetical protein